MLLNFRRIAPFPVAGRHLCPLPSPGKTAGCCSRATLRTVVERAISIRPATNTAAKGLRWLLDQMSDTEVEPYTILCAQSDQRSSTVQAASIRGEQTHIPLEGAAY